MLVQLPCVYIIKDWRTRLRCTEPSELQSMTPLHKAVKKGADVVAKVLLEAGADVNAVDDKVALHVIATNTSLL